jgi:hypothetical protein
LTKEKRVTETDTEAGQSTVTEAPPEEDSGDQAVPFVPDLDDGSDDPEGDEDEDGDDGDDDGEPGWLVVYGDGRQQILYHPDGVERNSVLNDMQGFMKKNGGVFKLGDHLLGAGGVIMYFGWSEDSVFPEIAQFDGLQSRVEALLNAVGMTAERVAWVGEQVGLLSQHQAQLQAAQAQLFQEEMAEMISEQQRQAADTPDPGKPLKVPQGRSPGKKGSFRPPSM